MKATSKVPELMALLWLAAPGLLPAAPTADSPAAPKKGESTDGAETTATAELPLAQEQVLRKYQRFEEVLLRMSELTAAADPKRAALLRKAVGQSKDKLVGVQFDRLVDLLKRDRLAEAVTNQKEVEKDLKQLLDLLLSEQRGDRLKNERERIKEQIRRINELINKQQQLEGQTQGGADPKKLAPNQGKLGEQAGKLADDMKEAEAGGESKQDDQSNEDTGKPGDESKDQDAHSPEEKGDKKSSDDQKPPQEPQPGDSGQSPGKPPEGQQPPDQPPGQNQGEQSESDQPPPSDNEAARQRVREAQKAMDDARQKLEEAKREGAAEDQDEARRKLEEAKAKLEEILRQLREEEVERTLALLEARFRKMLQMENEVYEGTVRLDRVPAEDRTRNDEIEAGRLGRKQRSVLDELRGAEVLLREDGSSVAFPEAVEELREDMETVAARLAQSKVDALTQTTEKDIIAALEEMIAAFQKAQKDQEEQQQRQGQPQAGESQEPPLVDNLAESRMIRALQMRVNKRTQEYAKQVSGDEGQADQPELLEALEKLSQREARI